jgi:glycerol uptake facilitator-like aquaporin
MPADLFRRLAAEALIRRLAAEGLGTAFLLVAVVGSGIMAERLSAGNMGIALLANAIATGAALVVLITVLGPLSGAHFNPAVSLFFALRGAMPGREALLYGGVQVAAAVLGVWLAHAMFAMPLLQISTHLRDGLAQVLAEFIATFGLLLTIAGALRFVPASAPMARMLTDSFSGIAPSSAPGFIAAQLLAVFCAWPLLGWLLGSKGGMEV